MIVVGEVGEVLQSQDAVHLRVYQHHDSAGLRLLVPPLPQHAPCNLLVVLVDAMFVVAV